MGTIACRKRDIDGPEWDCHNKGFALLRLPKEETALLSSAWVGWIAWSVQPSRGALVWCSCVEPFCGTLTQHRVARAGLDMSPRQAGMAKCCGIDGFELARAAAQMLAWTRDGEQGGRQRGAGRLRVEAWVGWKPGLGGRLGWVEVWVGWKPGLGGSLGWVEAWFGWGGHRLRATDRELA